MKDKNQPLIAIDLTVFQFDGSKLNVVLGKRQYKPFEGQAALPGVLLLSGETLEGAAYRAAEAKVGFSSDELSRIQQVGAYDNSDRDPRGPTISILSYSISNKDELPENVSTAPVNALPELPFDHNELIGHAASRLAEIAFRDKETLQALLGESFTTAAARKLAEELKLGLNTTNLTRFLRSVNFIEESEETVQEPGQKGRPTKLWRMK